MFSKLATVFVAALAATAVATDGGAGQCNTGPIQCCQQTASATGSSLSTLLGLLGAVLSSVDGIIGVGCTPITVIGTGSGANCVSQPVCCTGNTFNGLVNVGCTPVNINA